jgi:hypothetical protein
MSSNPAGGIIQTINLGLCIAIIVYTVRIETEAKNGNPLEKYDNKTNPINISYAQLEKYCQCGEDILKNICTEEQIISGCYDITPNKQKSFLRSLEPNVICSNIKADLIDKKGKYSEVFTLNYDMVYKMSLGILIVDCCILGVIIVLIISVFGFLCCGEGALCLLAACAPCIIVIVLFSGITNLVLFIILLVNFYKGRTTGEFLEYYSECLNDEEKVKLFSEYTTLNNMHSYMTVFIILNSIGSFFNYLGSCFSKPPSENN